jgi:hypothetical protein
VLQLSSTRPRARRLPLLTLRLLPFYRLHRPLFP